MSNIEWTNRTWNPTTGCTYYSSKKNGGNECLNCYAESMTKRLKAMGQERYKQGFDVFVEHEDVLDEPYSWKKPSTVFVNSMSDLLHKDCSDDFVKKVFNIMQKTPQHTYQILTKRNDRLEKIHHELQWSDNIWMGVSSGTQYGTRRISALINSSAKNKFLSIEPFIQEITEIDLNGIDWVIVGGESGNNTYKIEKDENGEEKYQLINGKVVYTYVLDDNGKKILDKKIRPMQKEWVDFIKNKCVENKVPFFFKQWGKLKNNPNKNDPTLNKEHRYYAKGGCQIDGKIYWANPTMEDDSIPMINLFDEDYYIMDEYEELHTIWELKSHLPFPEKDLYDMLKENIKINDLNDPILYYLTTEGKKMVIAGHTRLKACIALKKKNIPTKEIKENFTNLDEIKLWMIKNQCERRNLSNIEKIKLAFLSRPTIEKIAKENLSKAGQKMHINTTVDTNTEIAKIAGVGRTTVVKYCQILATANENIKSQLNLGEISIGKAYGLTNSTKKDIHKNPCKSNSSTVPNFAKKRTAPMDKSDFNVPFKKAEQIISNIIENDKDNESIEVNDKSSTSYQEIIILQNFSDGEQKLKDNKIDVIMCLNRNDEMGILKNNLKYRIGVFYLH